MTPMKAIRAKCLDCCCYQYKEVELCPSKACSLWPYRFGKNPNIKLTEEQKATRAAHLKRKPTQLGEFSSAISDTGKDTSQLVDVEKEAQRHG